EGGEGSDTYVIAGSQFDSMDTIVGLDFGGAGEDEGVDHIVLGSPESSELAGFILQGNELALPEIGKIVGGGEVKALSDNISLEQAVATLFEGDGVFDKDSGTGAN